MLKGGSGHPTPIPPASEKQRPLHAGLTGQRTQFGFWVRLSAGEAGENWPWRVETSRV
ncbi:hypothetical protein PGB90_006284 [Kerria lacca]